MGERESEKGREGDTERRRGREGGKGLRQTMNVFVALLNS
jgi:hypothetical protein